MQIAITFRHMEASNPIRAYAEEKVGRVKKYIDEPIDAQVVLTVAKKIRHKAEVTLTAKGITIKGSEETGDMYASIDAVVDKIERQLKRYREKLKAHKPLSGRERQVSKTIFDAESIDTGDGSPEIVRTDNFIVKPMAVEEAVMQMNLMHKEFLVYTDASSEEVNVVYRRKDGNYGVIVPQAK
jgi:putative sigma-54 modulation protein